MVSSIEQGADVVDFEFGRGVGEEAHTLFLLSSCTPFLGGMIRNPRYNYGLQGRIVRVYNMLLEATEIFPSSYLEAENIIFYEHRVTNTL